MESRLALQNPWWADKTRIREDEKVKNAMGRKHRLLYGFEPGNCLVVGPRQTGKTTYLKLMVNDLLEKVNPKNILLFACDMLRDGDDIIEVIRTFDLLAGEGHRYVFLDEVTSVDGWEKAVKFLLDSPLSRDKTIKVTGSSSIGLKRERFPGRPMEVKEFLPLGFREFCTLFGSEVLKQKLMSIGAGAFRPKDILNSARELVPFFDEIRRLFHTFLECGGYPRAFFELIEEGGIREDTYRSCFDAVMFDVTKLGRSEKTALSVLLGVLRRYGNKFSLNSIAKEMEVGSHLTVRDYLEILEGLYALRSYHQLDLSRKVPLFRKERKVYLLDPFLYRVFCRYLSVSPDLPSLVEGVVGEHLRRSLKDVYFFSDKREVDFVVGDVGIEVKWQTAAGASDFPKVGIKNKVLLGGEHIYYLEKINLVAAPVPAFLLILPARRFSP
ncbi:MAG: ATP-binding protein [Candidatus Hodarchaeaceae archaeon]|nr:ATP-binding protein [Candidatus Hodarchaeaceae archaeon]